MTAPAKALPLSIHVPRLLNAVRLRQSVESALLTEPAKIAHARLPHSRRPMCVFTYPNALGGAARPLSVQPNVSPIPSSTLAWRGRLRADGFGVSFEFDDGWLEARFHLTKEEAERQAARVGESEPVPDQKSRSGSLSAIEAIEVRRIASTR